MTAELRQQQIAALRNKMQCVSGLAYRISAGRHRHEKKDADKILELMDDITEGLISLGVFKSQGQLQGEIQDRNGHLGGKETA